MPLVGRVGRERAGTVPQVSDATPTLAVVYDHAGPSTDAVRIEPAVTAETRPFWEAAGRGVFLVERCGQCGATSFPPRGICRACGTFDPEWIEAPTEGVLYSFTVNHQEWLPGVGVYGLGLADFPATPGVRLLARLSADFDLDTVAIGEPVRLVFAPAASGPPLMYLLPRS